ncbi:GNAT family N-acetyltransferase [Nonomuraea sp. M3C6]|uniref:GNAT family N-acetyltransferase n=1 Tax=Nonomuraea marmarensis TaxID=3351344 RepID=A0ABW7ATB4_9ACTN
MSGSETVRGLQERTARALPAEHIEDVEGWWLRHAPSCAWWVGTVLPHGAARPGELVRRVVGAEEFYAGRGAAARFQISMGACPEGLDTVLAKRGYRRESLMSLQVASTARVLEQAPAGSLRVRVDDRPTRAWFEIWHAVHGHHGGESRSEWDLLARVQRPGAYASAMVGEDVVAVGRAVADTGWAGVFGMATLAEARGKGAARTVLAALAGWAGARAADRMYLQVERDNLPALRLYERTGFRELCGYHYRTAGTQEG